MLQSPHLYIRSLCFIYRGQGLGRRAASSASSDGFQGLQGLLDSGPPAVGPGSTRGGGLPEGQLLRLIQQQAQRDAQIAAAARCAALAACLHAPAACGKPVSIQQPCISCQCRFWMLLQPAVILTSSPAVHVQEQKKHLLRKCASFLLSNRQRSDAKHEDDKCSMRNRTQTSKRIHPVGKSKLTVGMMTICGGVVMHRRVEEVEGELQEVHRELALRVEQEASLKVNGLSIRAANSLPYCQVFT